MQQRGHDRQSGPGTNEPGDLAATILPSSKRFKDDVEVLAKLFHGSVPPIRSCFHRDHFRPGHLPIVVAVFGWLWLRLHRSPVFPH
jgi:hypothetical protein